MIDVRRLALLRELALRGTIAATAASMHLTGPAVSQQLAVLEREAGVPLLRKHGRTVAMTPAGQLLVAHADVLLGDLATAEADLAALRGGTLGTVYLAAFPSAARTLVTRLWSPPSTPQTDALDLRLVEHEPERGVAALAARDVDIAVVHSYNLLPRDLPAVEQEFLLEEPVLLALHPAEAAARDLAAGAAASLADFADARWLLPGVETSCHEMVRRACGAAGYVPKAVIQATDFAVLAAAAAAGAGVALIPRMALPAPAPDLSLHPLRQPVTRTVTALTRPGENGRPALRHVLDALQAATRRVSQTAPVPLPSRDEFRRVRP